MIDLGEISHLWTFTSIVSIVSDEVWRASKGRRVLSYAAENLSGLSSRDRPVTCDTSAWVNCPTRAACRDTSRPPDTRESGLEETRETGRCDKLDCGRVVWPLADRGAAIVAEMKTPNYFRPCEQMRGSPDDWAEVSGQAVFSTSPQHV
jgi:hypothetical protein